MNDADNNAKETSNIFGTFADIVRCQVTVDNVPIKPLKSVDKFNEGEKQDGDCKESKNGEVN